MYIIHNHLHFMAHKVAYLQIYIILYYCIKKVFHTQGKGIKINFS